MLEGAVASGGKRDVEDKHEQDIPCLAKGRRISERERKSADVVVAYERRPDEAWFKFVEYPSHAWEVIEPGDQDRSCEADN